MQPQRDEDVLDHLQALMFQYKAQMQQALGEGEHGLALMEGRALRFFAHHPGGTATDLVQHTGRDKAQVTRLVKQLLERGLIEREQDEADRRSHRLRLTESGRAVQRAMQQHRKRVGERLMAGFGEDERSQLLGLLQRMRDNFESPAKD